MKKIIFCISVFLCGLLLVSCSNDVDNSNVNVRVIAPSGSPALAQCYLQGTYDQILGANLEVEVVSGTDPLVAAFGSSNYDIIYAPSNLGVRFYNANGNYQFLGTVVWGNLYFATVTTNEFSLNSLDGMDITMFGENTVPAIVANEVINENNISCNIEYLQSTAETQSQIILDNSKIVLIAEPALSALKVKLGDAASNLKTINLTTEWEKITGEIGYPQAGVFVSKEFNEQHSDIVSEYVRLIEESCQNANDKTSVVANLAIDLEYGFPLAVLNSAILNSNIQFKNANDSKKAMEDFLQRIIDNDLGTLIGGKLPDNDFYIE